MILAAIIIYLAIGFIGFSLVKLMDGSIQKKWIPTFVLTVSLWPVILIVWGVAAMISRL